MTENFTVQTREDGSLRYFNTIREAVTYAKDNPEVWKVSWTNEMTGERIRLVRYAALYHKGDKGELTKHSEDVWVYEPIVLPLLRS